MDGSSGITSRTEDSFESMPANEKDLCKKQFPLDGEYRHGAHEPYRISLVDIWRVKETSDQVVVEIALSIGDGTVFTLYLRIFQCVLRVEGYEVRLLTKINQWLDDPERETNEVLWFLY